MSRYLQVSALKSGQDCIRTIWMRSRALEKMRLRETPRQHLGRLRSEKGRYIPAFRRDKVTSLEQQRISDPGGWRCGQSGANPPLPNSLFNRENTGKICEFGQFDGIFSRILSLFQSVSCKFPGNRNREFYRRIRVFPRDNRETY